MCDHTILPGPVGEQCAVREAACIHTNKIYDSCQAKDCLEDLNVYLTVSGQQVLETAQSVKGARAELLYVSVQVEPVGFNRGFYAVDLRYFYRICADVYPAGCCRPSPVCGLAWFDKRCMLFGSQGTAKIFSSQYSASLCSGDNLSLDTNLPTAVVEAVDPIVLGMKLVDLSCLPPHHHHRCHCQTPLGELPAAILEQFGEPLASQSAGQKRLFLTLGQFSILRMERDSQLLIPVYDYCMPEKECRCDAPSEEDPCRLFQRVDFPVGEFFPPAGMEPGEMCGKNNKPSCGC